MEQWFRDRFTMVGDDVSWVAENGQATMSDIEFLTTKFNGLETTYEAFMSSLEAATENPIDNGVNWGNHVKSWKDQGILS